MCKNRGDALVSEPQPQPRPASLSSRSRSSDPIPSAASTSSSAAATSFPTATTSSSTSSWSTSSLSILRGSLFEKPSLYSYAEIASATNNFLAKRLTSSSWRCSLRGQDSVVQQRPFRGDPTSHPACLAAACKSHHRSLVRLLGSSLSSNYIYVAYEFAPGVSLAECLRNPRNPSFTPLSSWISRIQIASDLAQGLAYIHQHCASGGIIHNGFKSSAIIVSEQGFNAKICSFATAFLSGELLEPQHSSSSSSLNKFNRSDNQLMKIERTKGYLAPEVIAGGNVSRMSDVFAFGVVLLELISGNEPLKFLFDRVRKDYGSVSVIETAREVIRVMGLEEEGRKVKPSDSEETGKRLRQWVDRRLRDSFPVEVVEKMIVVALRCVVVEAEKRPSMSWVEGKISKLFLESKAWAEKVSVPGDFSVSMAPR